MPLYRVNFIDNTPIAATEVSGDEYTTLKEFESTEGHTLIKWYIVQADSEVNAKEIAGKLAYQIWGDILLYVPLPTPSLPNKNTSNPIA